MYKDRNGENVKEVGFYDVEVWGENIGSMIAKNGVKGRGVRVVGRLKQDRWKTADGHNASKIFIVAEHVDFKPLFSQKQARMPDSGGEDCGADSASVQSEIENLAEAAAGIRMEAAAEDTTVF